MDEELAQKAVASALTGDWETAVKLNKTLLKQDSNNTETLNRLAKAYFESSEIKKAKATLQKILKIDQFNQIACKNLNKWKTLNASKNKPAKKCSVTNFIEEPGKTRIVSLLHPGDTKIIGKLNAGDEVTLMPHAHRVSIISDEGKYIGRLPDDLAARLRRLIKLGNTYQVLIKSLEPKNVKIFIRETQRSAKCLKTPSFPAEKVEYISFTPPELVHKKD